jgi:hypothetical protein
MGYVAANYSLFMAAIPGAVLFILKIIAIYHPSVKTDKVRDLIEMWAQPKQPAIPAAPAAPADQAMKALTDAVNQTQ